ncbi:MAG TPA: plastocyanin/azurin family copper-binding protein [Gemmatimonadales bacterium]|jgi:plastocyanin|nr:plastocyanin/azurin family copper-binding protein [Gemmatimonadales bacterium]
MRVKTMVAGLAVLLAACGGEKAGNQTPAADTSAQAAAPSQQAAPAAGTGTVHNVNMVLEGANQYKFVPDHIEIHPGDKIVWHDVSGGPHNVSFWADSIPSAAVDPLKAAMPDQGADLQGPLLTEPNATYEITFANVPAGEYKYYCLPHLAFGMRGTITVTQ